MCVCLYVCTAVWRYQLKSDCKCLYACVIKNTYISAIACNVVVLNVSGCEPAHMRVRVYVFLSLSVYACECVCVCVCMCVGLLVFFLAQFFCNKSVAKNMFTKCLLWRSTKHSDDVAWEWNRRLILRREWCRHFFLQSSARFWQHQPTLKLKFFVSQFALKWKMIEEEGDIPSLMLFIGKEVGLYSAVAYRKLVCSVKQEVCFRFMDFQVE